MAMEIHNPGHPLLTVADIDARCDFYAAAPGKTVRHFGAGREILFLVRRKSISTRDAGGAAADGRAADARLGGFVPVEPNATEWRRRALAKIGGGGGGRTGRSQRCDRCDSLPV